LVQGAFAEQRHKLAAGFVTRAHIFRARPTDARPVLNGGANPVNVLFFRPASGSSVARSFSIPKPAVATAGYTRYMAACMARKATRF
jgi:hypothetical protein